MNRCKALLPVLLALMSAMVGTTAIAGAIYKWTDEQGNVHFSTTPPPAASNKATTTGLSSEGRSGQREVILEGTDWLGRKGDRIIKIGFSHSGGYSWSETSSVPGYAASKKTTYGKYQLDGDRLTLTELNTNREAIGTRILVATMASADSLRLADVNVSDAVYQLASKPTESRALSGDKELMISGGWSQVPYRTEDTLIAMVSFEDGIFYFHAADGRARIGDSPPRSNYHAIASGKWHVEGEWLVLKFWEATGAMASRSLMEERWRIVALEHRRMQLEDAQGRQRQVFVRKRTR